ncbi:MAG: GNAT family N-acetyltransferase [Alkalinema sp. CACIAM 70d]|nr:MAG: GNAT family N-acetyltransferase [Alkalinema sp. CACIAM 70d]
MMRAFRQTPNLSIRPLHYRDVDTVDRLMQEHDELDPAASMVRGQTISLSRWYGLLKFLSWFPNPLRHALSAYVAEVEQRVKGIIKVSPFNHAGTTWRVDRVAMESTIVQSADRSSSETVNQKAEETSTVSPTVSSSAVLTRNEVGSLLLRYCFETILQARTWILELDVNDELGLSLYRHNGFQPVAQVTYWQISATQLQELAEREPDLPNLLPVSNADAHLLYQLDNMAMPPLVRQVFDRHPQDFKTSLLGSLVRLIQQWVTNTEAISGYVFEPQRKVAIAYFQLQLCRDGSRSHTAQLTVHPAYTWLYPEVMAQMARIVQEVPSQNLEILSADYHPEREAYLERIGAERIAHTLLMSRSVWHKLRETRQAPALEGLQLADVIPGLQPVRKPVPGRITIEAKRPNHWSVKEHRPAKDASTTAESQTQDFFPPHDHGDPCC